MRLLKKKVRINPRVTQVMNADTLQKVMIITKNMQEGLMPWKPAWKRKSQFETALKAIMETGTRTTRGKGSANTGIKGTVNPRTSANSHILKRIAVIQNVPTKHILIDIGKHA